MINLEIDNVVVHTVSNTDELIIKDSSLSEGVKADLERRYSLGGVDAITSKIENCLRRMKDKYKDIPFTTKEEFVSRVTALDDYCDRDTREIPKEDFLPEPEQCQYHINNLTQAIKRECRRRIQLSYPDWKQRNQTASVIRILQKEARALKIDPNYSLGESDRNILTLAQEMDDGILHLRNKSDSLEASLNNLTLSELKAFNPNNDSHWQ